MRDLRLAKYRSERPVLDPIRPLSWWWALIGVGTVVASITVSTWWFLSLIISDESRLDAVKAGLGVGAGVGAVIAFLVTIRRLRLSERIQAHGELDAQERRITELYGKAADQLSSDKAPVRLAGLYSLERLAEDNPDRRQTIVNLLCAYLRMPYTPPDPEEGGILAHRQARQAGTRYGGTARHRDQALASPRPAGLDPREERQVRLTAQSILSDHLRSDSRSWGRLDVDLTSARLVDLDMNSCMLGVAIFRDAAISGPAGFRNAVFAESAVFERTKFLDTAFFSGARFVDGAAFYGSVFVNGATFSGAKFDGQTFTTATCAAFQAAVFEGEVTFSTRLGRASADFSKTTFTDGADFRRATFATGSDFTDAGFSHVDFGEATFDGATVCDGAHVADPQGTRHPWPHEPCWPLGWTITSAASGQPGCLVRKS